MPKKKSKKTFIIDTNVLLHDPEAIFAFDGNDVIIPMVVLEELDKHKSRQDGVGANARATSRLLDALREEGSLYDGVKLRNGSNLYIKRIGDDAMSLLPREFKADKNDHLILACVLFLQKEPNNPNVVLISKDINIRVKCDALGAHSQDYMKTRVVNSLDEMYSGVAVIENADEHVATYYQSDRRLYAKSVGEFYPNEIVVLKSGEQGTVLTKCVERDEQLWLIPLADVQKSFGDLAPRNKEQRFALDLLYDENINLVTLSGRAGSGKSLLCVAAALDQLRTIGTHQRYDKFIVMRPIQSVGKEIGFLPGNVDEKMEPWVAPIRDCISFLMGNKRKTRDKDSFSNGNGNGSTRGISDDLYLRTAQDKGLIEVEAITFMRGRSIPNSIILLDEAQNLSISEIKTLLTRAGEGSKIIVTGDVEQLDNPHVDTFTNGLSYIIEKFKTHSIAGHIKLLKGERSKLATLASEIL